jgi:hypothetical protein
MYFLIRKIYESRCRSKLAACLTVGRDGGYQELDWGRTLTDAGKHARKHRMPGLSRTARTASRR